jgi:hypothetical protein
MFSLQRQPEHCRVTLPYAANRNLPSLFIQLPVSQEFLNPPCIDQKRLL